MTDNITIPRALLEHALETLQLIDNMDNDRDFLLNHEVGKVFDAITALRTALTQPQPKSCTTCKHGSGFNVSKSPCKECAHTVYAYWEQA